MLALGSTRFRRSSASSSGKGSDSVRLWKLGGPACVLVAAAFLVSCELLPNPDLRVEALVDLRLPADVLVEQRRFETAKPVAGQRLLQGWRFEDVDGSLWIEPDERGARLEISRVEAHERTLTLALADAGWSGEIRLEHQGREIAYRSGEAAGHELQFKLPADLPLGRVAVDLWMMPPAPLRLEGTGLGGARHPGEVDIQADAISQGGYSIIEFVRSVEPGSRLLGRIDLPADAKSDQRFELHVARGERSRTGGVEPIEKLEWRRRALEPILGDRDFEVDLGPRAGLRRIRLVALGEGPPARWLDLRVESVSLRLKAPEAPAPPAPPIVVLYVLDALRADALGHRGGPEGVSPTLDRLAQEGVTFLDHQSVAPNTTASTKSLFTGRYFPLQGEKKLPADGPATLAELFAEAGYRTGAFSGNGNIGEPLGNIRGFEILDRAPQGERGPTTRSYNDDAERVHGAALEWLDGLSNDEMVFLYLHTVHPHSPYDPPEPFRSRFVTQQGSAIEGNRETLKRLTAGGPAAANLFDRERLRQLYHGGLAYNDAHLGTFLADLKSRLAGRDLLLIITSDHGEELYEHGGILHGFTLYREMLQIPLIFWWPGELEPRRIERATDSIDLHETLRHLLGQEPAEKLGEAGSLWPLLRGWPPAPGEAFAQRMRFAAKSGRDVTYHMIDGPVAGEGPYKLIWAPADGRIPGMGRGGARAFDIERVHELGIDPKEGMNLAGDPRLEIAWLRSRLRGFIERGSLLEVGEDVGEFDEETLGILRALGYVD